MHQLVMGRCRYLTSVSVFGIFVGIFSSQFGIRYRYFKILRYRFGISVFQLIHFKGHGKAWLPMLVHRLYVHASSVIRHLSDLDL